MSELVIPQTDHLVVEGKRKIEDSSAVDQLESANYSDNTERVLKKHRGVDIPTVSELPNVARSSLLRTLNESNPLQVPIETFPEHAEEQAESLNLHPSRTNSPRPWVVGEYELFRVLVRRDLDRARQLLNALPFLVNVRHPLGWAPIHSAILSGDPTLVKFFLDQPGVDITIKDKSSFDSRSPPDDVRSRKEELCPHIPPKDCTLGASPMHFACMVGNWEIITLLLDAGALIEQNDNAGKTPLHYFDTQRADLQVCKAYHEKLTAWRKRIRNLKPTSVAMLCEAIRDGDYSYCKQILDEDPSLARSRTDQGWSALHVAVINKKTDAIDLLLSYPTCDTNLRDSWYSGHNAARSSFASDEFGHRVLSGSTAMHYACLTGDMETVEKLLRAGADWEKVDNNDLLPEQMIDATDAGRGDDKKQEYRRLCEEEKERRRLKKLEQESERKAKEEAERRAKEEQRNNGSKPGEKNPAGSSTNGSSNEEGYGSSDSESEQRQNRTMLKKVTDEELRRLRRENPIEKIIGDKIIGQQGPVRSVSSAIRLRENGWVDPDRPLVLLFLGSSGVGKTELAKQITYYLQNRSGGNKTGSQDKVIDDIEKAGAFVRIDMSEFQHSHTVYNLTGSPKGYVGYEDGGSLSKKLRKNPKAVVLLDEIEKAHPDVLTVFLQVFDDGRITDSQKGVIYCKDALFIMTSNLASEEIREASPILRALVAATENRHEQYLQVIGKFNRKIHPILKQSLKRDEFLGRINQIIVFLPLDESEISVVIEKELRRWRHRADERHSIKLSWSSEGKSSFVRRLVESYDVNYGVRSVINEVQRVAVQLLAEAHIRGDIDNNWLVHLDFNDLGDIDIKTEDPKAIIFERRGCRYI